MDVLLPVFEEKYDVKVDVVAVGTGEALRLGEAGDADVVLVHAREKEDAFMSAGYGVERRDVMHNEFVLVGPESDPAGVSGISDVVEAFSRIAAAESPFVSRGDGSGTHLREQALWAEAGIIPQGAWYRSVGQGMGPTLTLAAEQQAYTLSDEGTYIARRAEGLELIIVSRGDKRLRNPYGVIVVNPELHEGANASMARQFAQWITSAEAQDMIDAYRIEGQQLFHGDARQD